MNLKNYKVGYYSLLIYQLQLTVEIINFLILFFYRASEICVFICSKSFCSSRAEARNKNGRRKLLSCPGI